MQWGIEPAGLIGHSMGEYTAACLAGVFSLADALALVTTRARLFGTVAEGAMLSVPLGSPELAPLLGTELSIAASNGPQLSVASGPVAAIEALRRTLAARGVESSRLRINVAAHSKLLEPILPEFHAFVRRLDLRPPTIPVASNLTGTWMTEADATDPEYWVRHLRQTVRFADGLRALTQARRERAARGGPGPYAGHPRAAAGGRWPRWSLTSMPHPDEPVDDAAHMLAALGRLWIAGVEVDWARLHAGESRAARRASHLSVRAGAALDRPTAGGSRAGRRPPAQPMTCATGSPSPPGGGPRRWHPATRWTGRSWSSPTARRWFAH